MMKTIIDIIMATYNGEKYIRQQLDSLFDQDFRNWRLVVRDDGSTDETIAVLCEYKKRYPKQVTLIEDARHNLGVIGNFSTLLEHATGDYIMFCDQDDIWKPDKVAKTYRKMLEIEQKSPGKPALVFTDLELVDAQGKIIADSMWKYQKVDPGLCKDIYYLSVLNPVTGCTVMVNKKAIEVSLPIPEQACMHDWWFALNVVQKGEIGFLDSATICYRQHEMNVTATRRVSLLFFIGKITGLKNVLVNNYRVYKMLKALDFKISYCKVLRYKIKFICKRIFVRGG